MEHADAGLPGQPAISIRIVWDHPGCILRRLLPYCSPRNKSIDFARMCKDVLATRDLYCQEITATHSKSHFRLPPISRGQCVFEMWKCIAVLRLSGVQGCVNPMGSKHARLARSVTQNGGF